MSVPGAPFAFIGGGDPAGRVPPAVLDRADQLRDDADALAALWPQARVIVLDEKGNALSDADHAPLLPTGAEITGGPGGGSTVFRLVPAGTDSFCNLARMSSAMSWLARLRSALGVRLICTSPNCGSARK